MEQFPANLAEIDFGIFFAIPCTGQTILTKFVVIKLIEQ
jgi:hypothetical protein